MPTTQGRSERLSLSWECRVPEPNVSRREGGPKVQADGARAFCFRCHKAQRVCVCATIQRVDCQTPVHVVQHPRERHHPIGSLRFCELGLTRASTHVAEAVGQRQTRARVTGPVKLHARVHATRMRSDFSPPQGAVLVYPSVDAQPLDACVATGQRPRALVFLDGTWSTVRALLRGDPRLAALPRVKLAAVTPQRYRIRREPGAHHMSTLEAIVRALQTLEPTRADELDRLLAAFDDMIDRQIELAHSDLRPRFRKPRSRRQRGHALPAAFVDAREFVVAVVETTQVNRRDAPNTRARRELVRLSAARVRLDLDAPPTLFDAWVQTGGAPPSEVALQHMGAGPKALTAAGTPDVVGERFADFCRGCEDLVAWNQVDLDLLPAVEHRASWVLKGLIAKAAGGRGGALQSACSRLELAPERCAVGGRNGQKLGQALALVRWLRSPRGPR